MNKFALSLPTYGEIEGPANIPTGGFSDGYANTILSWALQVGFALAVLVVLLMLIFGGIQWITSEGDKEKIANARKRILFSILGLVIIVLSVLVVNTLLSFFGMPQFTPEP